MRARLPLTAGQKAAIQSCREAGLDGKATAAAIGIGEAAVFNYLRELRFVVRPSADGSFEILLTKGLYAIVDAADVPLLRGFKWRAVPHTNGHYVNRTPRKEGDPLGGEVAMHRVLLSAPPGMSVDHISGNTLDNRRSNLRLCSQTENARNSPARVNNKTGLKGVDLFRGEFRARIRTGDRRLELGHFAKAEDAARAYDAAALVHFGAFACLNFPNENGRRTAIRAAVTTLDPIPGLSLTRHPLSLPDVRSVSERQDDGGPAP